MDGHSPISVKTSPTFWPVLADASKNKRRDSFAYASASAVDTCRRSSESAAAGSAGEAGDSSSASDDGSRSSSSASAVAGASVDAVVDASPTRSSWYESVTVVMVRVNETETRTLLPTSAMTMLGDA